MEPKVIENMYRIVDKYVTENDLNELLKTFIRDKAAEGSKWSNITRCTHYMLGGNSPAIDLSEAMTEMAMLSFDIIDDLQDGDNKLKPWIVCSQAYTLNGILAFLFAFMAEMGHIEEQLPQGSPSLIAEVGSLLSQSINGQQIDLNGTIGSEADYLAMIQKKSGSLIRFACFMGYALIPNLDKQTVTAMNGLAELIGMISQMENDIRDVQRIDEKNDLLQKKRTLPILFLLMDHNPSFPYIQQYYDGTITQESFLSLKKDCIQHIEDSGCIEYSRIIQSLHLDQAEVQFNALPGISPWKERFKEMTFARQMHAVQ
jgi:competence protein ComQ